MIHFFSIGGDTKKKFFFYFFCFFHPFICSEIKRKVNQFRSTSPKKMSTLEENSFIMSNIKYHSRKLAEKFYFYDHTVTQELRQQEEPILPLFDTPYFNRVKNKIFKYARLILKDEPQMKPNIIIEEDVTVELAKEVEREIKSILEEEKYCGEAHMKKLILFRVQQRKFSKTMNKTTFIDAWLKNLTEQRQQCTRLIEYAKANPNYNSIQINNQIFTVPRNDLQPLIPKIEIMRDYIMNLTLEVIKNSNKKF